MGLLGFTLVELLVVIAI
ncbi:MAG: prepilin-type N-terminal cleavage/methylation domain-containing protein, partial [Planctomycetaceae bacterium]|nr:prepilin-type N-terminal cleavage/methylation domain-containing protein [Planctomycetaceae bacterium]